MPHLILIRHAASQPIPSLSSHLWPLSEQGLQQCATLADRLSAYCPAMLASSPEPKALQTAEALALRFSLPIIALDGLKEHDREGTPYRVDHTDFEAQVQSFFSNPNDLVYGNETAVEALARFETAVAEIIRSAATDNSFIVTHGTVMSLFHAARTRGADGFAFWQSLNMPAYVAYSLPTWDVAECVLKVTG
jgi:broad specificity phosphatase PhoE